MKRIGGFVCASAEVSEQSKKGDWLKERSQCAPNARSKRSPVKFVYVLVSHKVKSKKSKVEMKTK